MIRLLFHDIHEFNFFFTVNEHCLSSLKRYINSIPLAILAISAILQPRLDVVVLAGLILLGHSIESVDI